MPGVMDGVAGVAGADGTGSLGTLGTLGAGAGEKKMVNPDGFWCGHEKV